MSFFVYLNQNHLKISCWVGFSIQCRWKSLIECLVQNLLINFFLKLLFYEVSQYCLTLNRVFREEENEYFILFGGNRLGSSEIDLKRLSTPLCKILLIALQEWIAFMFSAYNFLKYVFNSKSLQKSQNKSMYSLLCERPIQQAIEWICVINLKNVCHHCYQPNKLWKWPSYKVLHFKILLVWLKPSHCISLNSITETMFLNFMIDFP